MNRRNLIVCEIRSQIKTVSIRMASCIRKEDLAQRREPAEKIILTRSVSEEEAQTRQTLTIILSRNRKTFLTQRRQVAKEEKTRVAAMSVLENAHHANPLIHNDLGVDASRWEVRAKVR